ncbi:MAG: hypothetical protein M3Q79_04605 [bacterium]|nr:hypothetical protein [bacterium]
MNLVEKLVRVLAPNDCLVCGSEGSILCRACSMEYIKSPPSRCPHCLKLTISSSLCQNSKSVFRLSHIWVSSDYDGVAKSILQSLKTNGVIEAAEIIAELIAGTLPYLPPETIVVPVPTTTRHRRVRGFDHTALIAKKVAAIKGLSYEPLLGRVDQVRQTGSGRQARLRQLDGKMYAVKPKYVKGHSLLIIDDVFTTGSTLREAARALKQAEAKHVSAAVFSQKVI